MKPSGEEAAVELFERFPHSTIALDQDEALDHETLTEDMSVADIEALDGWLWMVGSESNISALHHQRVILRDIIPTDQVRLHLVWFDRTIYIKPFPTYLFDYDFSTKTSAKMQN